jgi:hypothetical protein
MGLSADITVELRLQKFHLQKFHLSAVGTSESFWEECQPRFRARAASPVADPGECTSNGATRSGPRSRPCQANRRAHPRLRRAMEPGSLHAHARQNGFLVSRSASMGSRQKSRMGPGLSDRNCARERARRRHSRTTRQAATTCARARADRRCGAGSVSAQVGRAEEREPSAMAANAAISALVSIRVFPVLACMGAPCSRRCVG